MPLGRGWEERLYLASDLGLPGQLRERGVPEHPATTYGKMCVPKRGPSVLKATLQWRQGTGEGMAPCSHPSPWAVLSNRPGGGGGGAWPVG